MTDTTLLDRQLTLPSLHSPQHRSTTIWDDARTTDSCQLKLVTCVIKTSLHEHCTKTVIEFLLVCIVYPELSCVLLRYVSFTNKEWMNKKQLKNVGPIRHCEPFYIAIHQVSLLSHAATVARRLRIDVTTTTTTTTTTTRDRGPLWPHRMGPMNDPYPRLQ